MVRHSVNDDILILVITLLVVILIIAIVTIYMNRGPPQAIRRVRDIPTPPLTPVPGDVEDNINDFSDY